MEPLVLLFILEELSRMRYEEVWKNKNRVAVRDFWINKLATSDRKDIIRGEEILVFMKLREIQTKECDCGICDKKRQQLKNDIHQVYKEYLCDLKRFDDQDKSMIAYEVLLSTEASHLRMIVNIETKEMISDSTNEDTHRKEYYIQLTSVFCLFAARMLDKRIIRAYDESIVLERQMKLIQEEEDEKKRIIERKQQKSEHRKDVLNKKRLLKQQEQEKLMAEQRKKEEEEAKARKEKEHRSELKRQAKKELREKQKLELEQQRRKSFAKLKKRKEQDAIRKRSKSVTSAPSTEAMPAMMMMMSPASSSTEVTGSTWTADDDELLEHDDKVDACVLPIGYFQLPVMLTLDEKSNESFFINSWMDHIKGVDVSHSLLSVNKTNIWSNGWHASASISKDFYHNLFKHTPTEKSNEMIVQEARHVYSVLDKISFAKYTRTPESYTLSYLLHMMHELLSNNTISMHRLQQALDASDVFHCELKQPQNVVTVQLANPH